MQIDLATHSARISEPADGLPLPRRIWAIAAISFGTSLFVIDGSIANVALPTIAAELGIESGAVVAVVTLYQLVLVMALFPFASLGDRIGHRTAYQIGQAIFLVASAAALLVDSFGELLLVRGAQAIGAGMALSVSAAMLRQVYPARQLGSGLGINSVIVASSNALAPTLGGLIVGNGDWRWVFCAAVPFAVISLLLGRALPDPKPRGEAIDWIGGVWSAVSVGLVIGGLELAIHGGLMPVGVASMTIGVLSTVLLVRRERKRTRPVVPVDLIGQRVIGLSVLGAIAAFVASAALVVALPFRFETGMGYSPTEVGLLILPFPLTLLIVAPLAGWLSDRVLPSLLGIGGMALAIAGLLAMAFLPATAGWTDIAWRLVLCAAGFGFFLAPNSRLIIGEAPVDRAAAAGGLLSTSRLLGQTLGASMVGLVLALGLGLGPTPLLIAAALALVAGLCSVVRLRTT
ncbi:MFS transporter [Sphingomonas japonica]|uniref:DHA2 family multidrug resistance protein-like MFS transporter n=1 Tax=Sphingomonas japonica TaxID=511662 RepID=A0ABX0TY64_9SPHN|nr:MFS transporter [Sphingomonas japonica]NIJ23173.1 DHA2 family multidrug resistance protein-like MFS transporter [Sphingomonas japonica]